MTLPSTMRQSQVTCKQILTWNIPCLSYLSTFWHRKQKQNSHCFQWQKASWTTLKGFHLVSWLDIIWKKTFYFLASCCRDRWTNYLLPLLNHPTVQPHSCCFHPRHHRQMRAGSLASSHAGAGYWMWGQKQCSRQRRSAHGHPALAICRGVQGWLTPQEIKDFAVEEWERGAGGDDSMTGAEILGYVWNCGQCKIHWVAVIPRFFKHL